MESRTRVFEIIIWIALLLLTVAFTSHAGEILIQDARCTMRDAGPLTPALSPEGERVSRIAVLAAFAAVDYGQSVEMFFHGTGYRELNPLLPDRPTRRDMIIFGAAGIGLTWLLSEILPEPWDKIVLDSMITSERMNIEENRRAAEGWNESGPPLRGRTIDGVPIVVTLRF